MDGLTALITIGSVIIGSSLTFLFDYLRTKSNNRTAEHNRNIENLYVERRNAYIEFLNALPEAYNCLIKPNGSFNRYSSALNKIYLVGSQKLINALKENNYILNDDANFLNHGNKKPLKIIINIMREDLGYNDKLEETICCIHSS